MKDNQHTIYITRLPRYHKYHNITQGMYSHVTAYGNVPPSYPTELLFHQKFLDVGPILVKKDPFMRVPFHKKLWKIIAKLTVFDFEVEKPLIEMDPDLWKFQKKKESNQSFFEGEKSLDTSRGFRPLATHPIKKSFWVPLLPGKITFVQLPFI